MSATIYWRALPASNKTISVGSPSLFVQSMDKVFGKRPWRLGESDLPILKGMAAVDGLESENPYQTLIDKIGYGDDAKNIEVWPEY